MYNFLLNVDEKYFYTSPEPVTFKMFMVNLIAMMGKNKPQTANDANSVLTEKGFKNIFNAAKNSSDNNITLQNASLYKYIKYFTKAGLLLYNDNKYSLAVSMPNKTMSIHIRTNDMLITGMVNFDGKIPIIKDTIDKYFASIDEPVEHNPQPQTAPKPVSATTDNKVPIVKASPNVNTINKPDDKGIINRSNTVIKQSASVINTPISNKPVEVMDKQADDNTIDSSNASTFDIPGIPDIGNISDSEYEDMSYLGESRLNQIIGNVNVSAQSE